MNTKEDNEYKDIAVELLQDIKNNLKSKALIIDHNLDPALCLKILYTIFKVISFDRGSITKDNVIHFTKGKISFDKIMVIINQFKGRNNVTPTCLQLIVAEKGEWVY